MLIMVGKLNVVAVQLVSSNLAMDWGHLVILLINDPTKYEMGSDMDWRVYTFRFCHMSSAIIE